MSIYLENDVISDPEPYRPKIDYISHKDTLETCTFFPWHGTFRYADEEAWAIERKLITHNGTHLDAPYHYATTMDKVSGQLLSMKFHGLVFQTAKTRFS